MPVPGWFDDSDLLRRIGERRKDPVFMERLRRLIEDNMEILQRLEISSNDPQQRIVFDHVTGEVRKEDY